MKRVRVLEFAEGLPVAALASLEECEGAAWLIDVDAGRILAATVKGAALLDLVGGACPPLLDASTPALVRLRGLVRLGALQLRAPATAPAANSATSETLVFWTRGRAVCARCRVEFLEGAPARALVTAALEAGAASDVGTWPRAASAPSGGDDATRLKEIARRIRNGQIDTLSGDGQAHGRNGAGHASATASGAEPSPEPEPSAPRAVRIDPPVTVSQRASLAHEIKTPVSAIAAAAEIMKDERFGPLGSARYVDYATDIHNSAMHILRIIDRMLAEGGAHHDLDFVEIDPGQVLQASVSELAPLAERAGIALVLDLDASLPHVVADATSLRQIVFNLVTNALKFTNRGGQVTVAGRYSPDGPLAISVADTGLGMTRAEIDRLLDASLTAPAHHRNGNGSHGLGLGLPLVRALATANGAELVIDSAPGLGTSATVVFKKERVIPI